MFLGKSWSTIWPETKPRSKKGTSCYYRLGNISETPEYSVGPLWDHDLAPTNDKEYELVKTGTR